MQEEGARDNTVRLLLRHGADVNATDDCGRTALSYVCERRCNDILRILIKEHNVDPDITDTNGMFCFFENIFQAIHNKVILPFSVNITYFFVI